MECALAGSASTLLCGILGLAQDMRGLGSVRAQCRQGGRRQREPGGSAGVLPVLLRGLTCSAGENFLKSGLDWSSDFLPNFTL